MINAQTCLNTQILEKISNSNYSYVGIYEKEKHNIVGTVKTKDLIDAE
jgi:metal transporter CNNM